jgi:hypothetical protein
MPVSGPFGNETQRLREVVQAGCGAAREALVRHQQRAVGDLDR